MRRIAAASLVFLGLAACAWPPSLPSGPGAPSPAQAANQATGTVDQAAGTVGQTTQAVTQSVPRIAIPAVSVPRLGGGGGLLRR